MLVKSQFSCPTIFLVENISENHIKASICPVVHFGKKTLVGNFVLLGNVWVVDFDEFHHNKASAHIIAFGKLVTPRAPVCKACKVTRSLVEREPSRASHYINAAHNIWPAPICLESERFSDAVSMLIAIEGKNEWKFSTPFHLVLN